jgi:hypothetical protein
VVELAIDAVLRFWHKEAEMRRTILAVLFLAVTSVPSNPASAADPYCVYRLCDVSQGQTCYPCYEPLDNCTTLAYKRVYYYICDGCTVPCQSDQHLTGGPQLEFASLSCASGVEPVFDEQVLFYVIDMSDSYSTTLNLMSSAPELLLQLASAGLEQNSQIENDTPLIAPIDRRNNVGSAGVIPSSEFAHRALSGTLREEDVAELASPTGEGTFLQVEARASRLPGDRIEVMLRSSLIRHPGNLGGQLELVRILNSAVATLILVQDNYAAVQGFEDRGRIAGLYRIEQIEITSPTR